LENGFRIVSGGTDTHMILVDVRTLSMTGAEAENILKSAGIVVNKNSIPFDPNPPVITSGIRIGTAAVTSRGFLESDMRYLANLIIDALRYKTDAKSINKISNKVSEFARSFKLPGVDD
jgi:glycine hydroxymethyltransferase